MSKKEAGSKLRVKQRGKGGGGKSKGGKQLKCKQKKAQQRKQQPPSCISTGSAELLHLSRVQASSGSFDKWLQVEYLPSDFKPAEEDKQVKGGVVGGRKRWYRRLRFDHRALLHSFSIAILVIWLASLLIFTLYLFSPCSPLAVPSSSDHKATDKPTEVTTNPTTTQVTTSKGSSSNSTTLTLEATKNAEHLSKPALEKTSKPRSIISSSDQQQQQPKHHSPSLRHHLSHYSLGSGFARLKDIIFFNGKDDDDNQSKGGENRRSSKLLLLMMIQQQSGYSAQQKANEEELTLEENLPSCIVLTVFAIADLGLATILLAHLLLYVLHVVELLGVIFPWFALELAYAACFVLVTFVLCVTLSIVAPFACTSAVVILGDLQFFCGLLFCFNRYRQCKAGQLPQDLDDDVDGDVIRIQPQLKNSVMAVRVAGPTKKHSPKKGGGKSKQVTGKQKSKVVYKKMFSKITPSSSAGAASRSGSSNSSSSNLGTASSSSAAGQQPQPKQSMVVSANKSKLLKKSTKQLTTTTTTKKSIRTAPSASGLKSFKSKSVRKTGGGKSGGGGKRPVGGKLDSAVEGNSLSISSVNYSKNSSAAGSSLSSDAK